MEGTASALRLIPPLDKDPQLAQAPLYAIRSSAAEALADMRRLLGVLREDEDGNELTPQPGLRADRRG